MVADDPATDSDGLLRSIVDLAFDAIISIDDRGTVLTFNRAAERMLGYAAAEVIGGNVSRLMPEPFRSQHDGYLSRYLATGEARIIGIGREVVACRQDGSTFPVELAVTGFELAGRRFFTGILRDLRERKKAEVTAASEHRLRSILDGMFVFVGLFSLDGVLLDVNQAPLAAAKLKAADMIGKPLAETYWASHSPQVQDQARAAIRQAASGETVREEFAVRVADEQLLTMDVVFCPLRNSAGQVVEVLASAVDISERRRAERELRSRLRQQEAVARLGSRALETTSFESFLTRALEDVREVLGTELANVFELAADRQLLVLRVGVGWRDGIVGRQVATGIGSLAGFTVATGGPLVVDDLRCETRFEVALALQEHEAASALSVVVEGDDGPWGVLSTYSRLTRRFSEDDVFFLESVANVISGSVRQRRAAYQLVRSEARYRTLATAMSEMILTAPGVGEPANFIGGEVFLGDQKDGWTFARYLELVHPEDREQVSRGWSESRAAQRPVHAEYRLRRRDGQWRNVVAKLFPTIDDRGGVGEWIGVIVDVTEQRQLEERLRQSQKMEAFGELAGGVAHDFNNLLTVISGFSSLLLATSGEQDPGRPAVTAIHEAAGRAGALTRQLLAFSRRTVLEPKVLDLGVVVRDTESLLARMIGEDVLLVLDIAPTTRRIRVDPGQLGQVLINLAVNARDAMPRGGQLTIAVRDVEVGRDPLDLRGIHAGGRLAPGCHVLLAVSDTGAGMTAEVAARAFEPFFTTKGVGKGTGLGLAVVHGIVEQSGGTIAVRSSPGAGSTFELYFPAIDDGLLAEPEAPPVEANVPRGAETILLVEDEPGVRRLATLILESYGYQVWAAADGFEALRLADLHGAELDLLLTDVVMPGMDGRQVAERLTARVPRIKVLYLSGYTDDAVVRHGILHEQVAFLPKPFTPAGLAAKVREVLDQRVAVES